MRNEYISQVEKGIGEECQVEEQDNWWCRHVEEHFMSLKRSRTTGQGHVVCDGSKEEEENEDQERSDPKDRAVERARRRHWHTSF